VKLLKLTTLNPERTHEIMKGVLDVLTRQRGDQELMDALAAIPTPEQVDESLTKSMMKLLSPPIHVNTSIHVQHFSFADLFCDENYIIGIEGSKIVAYLVPGATVVDELMAHTHGILLHAMLRGTTTPSNRGLMIRYAMICWIKGWWCEHMQWSEVFLFFC
jgi:hypothetical protein